MSRGVTPHLVWAAAGTLLVLGYLVLDIRASGDGILRPIRAGAKGPAAAVIAQDFPSAALPDQVGLDGQQFYAMARDPLSPDEVAKSLDHPQYRYQRPLLPVLAWVLHPSGGGPGLVMALVVVGVLGLFAGALAVGALAEHLRGPPWLALLYPLLPGTIWSLTTSSADGMAVSLSLVTIAATLRGRSRLALVAAVAAVLTKETTILVPLALALARRRKEDLSILLVPGLVLAAWTLAVRLVVPAGGPPSEALVLPLSGIVEAFWDRWVHGRELTGMASTVAALAAGVFVLGRRRGPAELRWVIGLQLALLSVCGVEILGDFGATRTTLMLLIASLVVITSGTGAAGHDGYPASTGARNLPV